MVGVTVGGLLGGYITKHSTRYRSMLFFATVSSSTSYLLLVLRWGTEPKLWGSLHIVPSGFGIRLVLSVSFVALTAKISASDMAAACSSFYMIANIRTAVKLATTSAVIQEIMEAWTSSRFDVVSGQRRGRLRLREVTECG